MMSTLVDASSPAAATVATALLRRRHARRHLGLPGGALLLGCRAVDGQFLSVQGVRRRHHLQDPETLGNRCKRCVCAVDLAPQGLLHN